MNGIPLLVLAGWITFGTLYTISRIGKPRKPFTPADATAVVIINAVFITVMVLDALKIGL